MTTTEINKRFAELVGLCWHELLVKHGAITGCSCGENRHTLYYAHQNPDYCADSRLVLEVMKGRKDYLAFLDSCLPPFTSSRAAVTAHWVDIFMDKTAQLALKAIEWMEEQKPKAPLCDGCLYKNNNWYCDNYHNRNKCTKYVLESKT